MKSRQKGQQEEQKKKKKKKSSQGSIVAVVRGLAVAPAK